MAKTEKNRDFYGFSVKRSTKIFFEGTEAESLNNFYGKQAQILERGKERKGKGKLSKDPKKEQERKAFQVHFRERERNAFHKF